MGPAQYLVALKGGEKQFRQDGSAVWAPKVAARPTKKLVPRNFYGALAVIVILGLALTAYSRYEYQNPAKRSTTATIAPGIGSSQYAALSIQDCGTTLPSLSPDETYKGGGFIVESRQRGPLDAP